MRLTMVTISSPSRYSFSGGLFGRLWGWLRHFWGAFYVNQLGPDSVPVVGAKVPALLSSLVPRADHGIHVARWPVAVRPRANPVTELWCTVTIRMGRCKQIGAWMTDKFWPNSMPIMWPQIPPIHCAIRPMRYFWSRIKPEIDVSLSFWINAPLNLISHRLAAFKLCCYVQSLLLGIGSRLIDNMLPHLKIHLSTGTCKPANHRKVKPFKPLTLISFGGILNALTNQFSFGKNTGAFAFKNAMFDKFDANTRHTIRMRCNARLWTNATANLDVPIGEMTDVEVFHLHRLNIGYERCWVTFCESIPVLTRVCQLQVHAARIRDCIVIYPLGNGRFADATFTGDGSLPTNVLK